MAPRRPRSGAFLFSLITTEDTERTEASVSETVKLL